MLSATLKNEFRRYAFMVLGCFSYAMSLDLFLVANGIVTGGFPGVGTILNALTGIGIGVFSVGFNIPVLLMGRQVYGTRFILRCFLNCVVLSVFIDLFAFLPPITTNPLMASIYGGVAQGIAIGLFCRYNVSSGGTELLARLIQRKLPSLSIGSTIAVLDGIIVVAGAVVFHNPENVLMALIVIFISARLSDTIITGLDHAKLCYIITDHADKVAEGVMARTPHGLTRLSGTGMYTKAEHNVLMTVVRNHQISNLRAIVEEADPKAFVIVSEATEVRGNGFLPLNEKAGR